MTVNELVENERITVHSSNHEAVNKVLQYLWKNYWSKKTSDNLELLALDPGEWQDRTFENLSISDPDSIDYDHVANFITRISGDDPSNIHSTLEEYVKLVKSLDDLDPREIRAVVMPRYEIFKQQWRQWFGETKAPRYDGNDILELGFMPYSSRSFAIMAFDMLEAAEIPSQIRHMRSKTVSKGHSVVMYEHNGVARCDPKWQKHPDFLADFSQEERLKFYRDPTFLAHPTRRFKERYTVMYDRCFEVKATAGWKHQI